MKAAERRARTAGSGGADAGARGAWRLSLSSVGGGSARSEFNGNLELQASTTLNTWPATSSASAAQALALAHPTRVRIWTELGGTERTISQLARRLGLNKGSVSHHLAVLVRAGLARRSTDRTVRGRDRAVQRPGRQQADLPARARHRHRVARDDARGRARRRRRQDAAGPPAQRASARRRPPAWPTTWTTSCTTCSRPTTGTLATASARRLRRR